MTADAVKQLLEILEGQRKLTMTGLEWRERLGEEAVELLDAIEVAYDAGRSSTVPCERMNFENCPRFVAADRKSAHCGNEPPECEPVELAEDDATLYCAEEELLVAALAAVLDFAGAPERLAMQLWSLGRVAASPSSAEAFFVSTRNAEDWRLLQSVLLERARGRAFLLVLPTTKFLPGEARYLLEATQGVLFVLHERLGFAGGGLSLKVRPEELLDGSMGSVRPQGGVPHVDVLRDGHWSFGLTVEQYRELKGEEEDYDVFIDQIRGYSSRRGATGERISAPKVEPRLFDAYRRVMEARNRFLNDEEPAEREKIRKARHAFEGPKAEIKKPLILSRKEERTIYGFNYDEATRASHLLIFRANS